MINLNNFCSVRNGGVFYCLLTALNANFRAKAEIGLELVPFIQGDPVRQMRNLPG